MATSLNRAELRTWLTMIGGIRALLIAIDRQLRDEAGMTHDDYVILGRLHRSPGHGMRMSDLAREAGFSPSRLSHAFDRMEASGWVCRDPSAADRRVTEARLTDLGTEMVESASATHFAMIKHAVFETLGPEEARQVAEAMSQVASAAGGSPRQTPRT